MKNLRVVLAGSIISSLLVGFVGGFFFVSHREHIAPGTLAQTVINRDANKDSSVDFSLFWQVWDRLHQRFVDAPGLDSQKLVYGAISGMVDAAGDPYTTFFEPVTSKKFQEEVSGEFSGVGMEIGKRNDAITVIAPIKDTPAVKAGIKAGDVIAKINDTSTEKMTVDEAVNLIRGKKGTTVHLTIIRQGQNTALELSIVRDTIKVPAVDWKLIDTTTAYLSISSFNGNVTTEFEKAAGEILNSSAQRLIIDLRDNPGGLLDAAVDIAGWMLPPQSLVVQEKFGNGMIQEEHASGNARLSKYPTVVLMNGGSASASEILAGALHDIRNIPLVGEKSFGKGSVQQLEDFYNGSSLKVTIAKWLTPNGVSISDTGIAPTTQVIIDPTTTKPEDFEAGNPAKDIQLKAALDAVAKLR